MGCVFEGGAQRIKGRQDSHGLEAELIQRIEANSSREINYLNDTLGCLKLDQDMVSGQLHGQ